MPETNRVVITGALGALGSVVAKAFAATGARLALVDRAPDFTGDNELLKQGHLFIGKANVADFAEAKSVASQVVAKFGGIDVLVNIAGGFRWETVADGDVGTWDLLYEMNLKTALCACKAAMPHLPADRGRIINVGAAAAAKASSGMGAYTASKAGVAKLTEALAEELKDKGITVNTVLPSIIDTPGNRAEMPQADFTRWVTPQALADVILFLSSLAARAITGASIPVTGRV